MPECSYDSCHHFRCPQCKVSLCEGYRFRIGAHSTFEIYKTGTGDYEGVEWDDDSFMHCLRCQHQGTVLTFTPIDDTPIPGKRCPTPGCGKAVRAIPNGNYTCTDGHGFGETDLENGEPNG